MRKIVTLLMMLCLAPVAMQAQRIYQKLGRGVVAVTRNSGQDVIVTWRKLTADPDSAVYNLYYRKAGTTDYTKLNSTPYTKTNVAVRGSSFGGYNTELAVTAVDPKTGVETEKGTPFLFKEQPYPNVWFYIPLDDKVIPDNKTAYLTKYAWPADMDGDGEIDAVVVDRLGGGAYDDAEDDSTAVETTSTNHKIQCYHINGTLMWTVEMGPNVNICAGQNDMVTVYDIDCDGKCDVIIKSSDGTRFWDKANNSFGKYVFGKDTGDTDGDGIIDYAVTTVTRNPPFYITVIDGLTGAEKVSAELKYSDVYDATDRYTRDNKKDYMSNKGYYQMGGHFAICHDGIHPYLAMKCLDRRNDDGHHDYVFAFGYDWKNGEPSNFHHFYTWSRNDKSPWPAEFHGNRVCDVDGDGLDEIIPGAFAVNPWKNMVSSAGVGHGDRFTVTDIDPTRPGLEHFVIQQSSLLGQLIYDAATGEHVKEWYLSNVFDVGRGQCQDVLPDKLGLECYSFVSDNIYDCKGKKTDVKRTYPVEPIWWDGDLLREGMAQRGGSGASTQLYIEKIPSGGRITEFFRDSNGKVHGNTGTRAAFWGDITGDWREENIQMEQGNSGTSTAIVGYSTHYETDYTINCLMEDAHYRLDETTRGYYQSPNTSFYLGTDMYQEPLFDCIVTDLRYKDGWNFTTFDQKNSATYADGKSLIFDISGDNSAPISLSSAITPSTFYLMNPKGHDYTFTGTGTLTGTTVLRKGMQGKATFNMDLNHTGKTVIHEGTLEVNGTIKSPLYLMSRGTLAGNVTLNSTVWMEGSHNYAGCRFMAGNDADKFGTITINNNVTLPGKVYIEVDMETATNKIDKFVVNGDLTLQGENYFRIDCQESVITAGTYTLAECTGTLTATPENVVIQNLDGVPYRVVVADKKIQIVIDTQRPATEHVLWAGTETAQWDYLTKNFSVNNEQSYFVTNDKVVFDDTAKEFNITVDGKMVTGGIIFNNNEKTYTFRGDGGMSGTGDLVKNGKGELRMELENSDYTGRTIINDGRLTVTMVSNAGKASSMGAAVADEGYLQINGAELNMEGDNVATDRIVTITDTATITVKSGSALTLRNQLKGSGVLVKDGAGQLNLTYAGTNSFDGVVIRNGILKQGQWQATVGMSGAPITFMGGQFTLADNSSMSTTPQITNPMIVAEGSEGTVSGSFRCNIKGTLSGKGTMTYISGGGRCYFNTEMSNFEGTLIGKGAELLLQSGVTDMKKVILKPTGEMTVYPDAAEVNIGSIISEDKTARIAGKVVNIGYRNEDHSFAGQLVGTTVNKTGTAQWELTGTGSTAGINVKEGTLKIRNFTGVTTSSSMTVDNGGMLIGRGTTQSILLKKGATICPGIDANTTGTLSTAGNFIGYGGSILMFKVAQSGNDVVRVGGTLRLNGDTIRIQPMNGRTFAEGETIQIFEGTMNVNSKWIIDGGGYEWDDSQLVSSGKLICKGLATAISGVYVNEPDNVRYFDAQGLEVNPRQMRRHQVYIERKVKDGYVTTLKIRL